MTLGTTVFDIVGVLPASFTAATTTFFAGRPEIITLMPPVTPGTAGGTFHPLLRLEPGVTREQAQADMDVVVASVRANVPALAQQMPVLEDIRETIYPVGCDVMRFLFAAAVLVLLIGCANLANMLLARGRRYERETAVRSALGASRSRIVRPLLFEALLLGAAGSLLALAVTSVMFDALLLQVPAGAYGGAKVGVDLRIAVMALALGLGGGLLFAAVPAMRAARLDVLALLQGRHRRLHGQWRLGRPMIAVQVGLAVVLVFGAVVATRAFVDVLRIPLGFEPDRVAVVQVVPPPDSTDVGGFYRRLVESLAVRPDVVAVGATGTMPLGGATGWSNITAPDSQEAIAALAHTWPGFFETIGIAPVAGRLLQWTDAGTGAAVITEAAARALFGDGPALGQMIDAGTQGQLHVVGVVTALAIGAEPGRLVLLMVRQALVPVCVGLVAGVASAVPLARLAESRFVQLDTSEPWPLVLAGAVLLAATALAAFAPARRAARVDPTVVLRAE